MKKRSTVLILLCCFSVLTACSRIAGKTLNTEGNIGEPVTADEESIQDIEYEEVDNKIELLDLASNNVIEEIQFQDNESVDSYRRISDGYALIKSTYAEDVGDVTETEGLVISKGTPSEQNSYEYIRYDNSLQEEETIDISSMISKELLSEINECQSEPKIDPTGGYVAWSTVEGVYVLNLERGETMSLAYDVDDYYWYEVNFVSDTKLGFYSAKGDRDAKTLYGYWDLTSDELFYDEEDDYSPDQIRVSGNYLVLNDGENPSTHKSSGKVVMYDCKSNQSIVCPVDNTESTFACTTTDGSKLITYKCEGNDYKEHVIQVYDLATQESVSESSFDTETSVRFFDFYSAGNEYFLVGESDSGKVIYHAFTA